MITGEIKQRVDNVWQMFWNGGFTVPITILEQMTYLLFMKLIDDRERIREANFHGLGMEVQEPMFEYGRVWHNPETGQDVPYNELRWHVFKDLPPEKMLSRVRNDVFVFLRHLGKESSAYSRAMENTVFLITDPRMLTSVVEGLEALNMTDTDTMGDVYEYMLSKMAASGTNGQFRTPRHIIRMMVELMQPRIDDRICDPAMGSAGFLMEAARYIQEHQQEELFDPCKLDWYKNQMFCGSDSDATMMRIGCMNMMLHDVDQPQLKHRNSLSDDNRDTNRYTLCLANPPFAGSLDASSIAPSLRAIVDTKKTELLFLALMVRMLQSGGRCASVVPDTVLTGDNTAYRAIRSLLVDGNKMEAVITMPSGVFQPYSGVSTAIIIFTKTNAGGTDKVWFYDMRADGYSLTTQRTPTPDNNDIPDIIRRFHSIGKQTSRSAVTTGQETCSPNTTGQETCSPNDRKDQSFFVSADEIRSNGYDLSYKRYHEVEREVVEYESPEVIIDRIEQRQLKIDAAFAEFKKLLNS